jgi:toxin ParE1/3/4
MPYRVDILKSAQMQIVQQTRYVKGKWGAAKAKESYDSITAKLESLADHPYRGIEVPELVALGITNYRILIHEHHTKALYDVDDAQKKVTVHMVYGSSQDFQTLLYDRIIRYLM